MKPYSQQRPTSVTFVSTMLLIHAGFDFLSLLTLLFPRDLPARNLPVNINEVWLVVVPIILYGICGSFMLRGANWARLLFFIAVPLLNIVTGIIIYSNVSTFSRIKMASLPLYVLIILVVFVIAAAMLLSREANRFFIGKDRMFKKQQQPRQSDSRQGKPSRKSFDY